MLSLTPYLGGDSSCAHGPKFGLGVTRSILNAGFFAECLANNALDLYQKISQPISTLFCQLEKEEQDETLTNNVLDVTKRNQAIVASRGTPLLQGLQS